MKKFFLAVVAALTIMQHLIFDPFTSACLAAPVVQIGVTTDMLSNDKPVTGVLGFEMGPARLTAGAGYDQRGEGAFDLIARTKDGLYFGIGLFSERAIEYTEVSSSDTTITSDPFPGKGKGLLHKKKARKGGKVVTNNTYSFHGEDYATYPTALMGLAGRRFFYENRLIFGTSDIVSAQASFGVRW
jgi:hypothetical protein